MKFATAAATALFTSFATSATAFVPNAARGLSKSAAPAFVTSSINHSKRSFSTNLNMASVGKLTAPEKWLEGIDVFIFDCDGVIWRVSHHSISPLEIE